MHSEVLSEVLSKVLSEVLSEVLCLQLSEVFVKCLQGVPTQTVIFYFALAGRNMQVSFGLQVI